MIRAIINEMLGPLGRQALQFYNENSLAINGLVVLYGLVILLAHRNYLRVVNRAAVLAKDATPKQLKDPAAVWDQAIREASLFPLVAQRFSLLPHRAVPATLEKFAPLDSLREQLPS